MIVPEVRSRSTLVRAVGYLADNLHENSSLDATRCARHYIALNSEKNFDQIAADPLVASLERAYHPV
jgi:hypothetical protein